MNVSTAPGSPCGSVFGRFFVLSWICPLCLCTYFTYFTYFTYPFQNQFNVPNRFPTRMMIQVIVVIMVIMVMVVGLAMAIGGRRSAVVVGLVARGRGSSFVACCSV